MNKTAIACMLAAAVSGCASQTGVQVQEAQLSAFQKGITTEADVIRAFGAPVTSVRNSDGQKTIGYSFSQVKIRGATFIPIVGMFAGGADSKMNSTIFTFDKDGKMLTYQVVEAAYSSGAGGEQKRE